MGKIFGNLQRLYGINYYMLSPYELKPWKGFANSLYRSFCNDLPSLAILLGFGLVFITFRSCALEVHEKTLRKNPKDYRCDK